MKPPPPEPEYHDDLIEYLKFSVIDLKTAFNFAKAVKIVPYVCGNPDYSYEENHHARKMLHQALWHIKDAIDLIEGASARIEDGESPPDCDEW